MQKLKQAIFFIPKSLQMSMGNCVSGDSGDSAGRGGQPAAFYGAGPSYAAAETPNRYPGPPTAPPVVLAQHAAYAPPPPMPPAYAPPPPMPPAYAPSPMPSSMPVQSAPAGSGRGRISDSAYRELIEFLEGTQVMLALDCSGSMRWPVSKSDARSRMDLVLQYLASFMNALFEVDPAVDFYFFGSTIEHMVAQPSNFAQVLASARRNMGGTDTAGVMRQMWNDHNRSVEKTLAIIVTDGEPGDRDACFRCIQEFSAQVPNTLAFNYLFLQIGDDPQASAFLSALDNMVVSEGGNKHDIVDTNTFEAAFVDPRGLHQILVHGMTD